MLIFFLVCLFHLLHLLHSQPIMFFISFFVSLFYDVFFLSILKHLVWSSSICSELHPFYASHKLLPFLVHSDFLFICCLIILSFSLSLSLLWSLFPFCLSASVSPLSLSLTCKCWSCNWDPGESAFLDQHSDQSKDTNFNRKHGPYCIVLIHKMIRVWLTEWFILPCNDWPERRQSCW